MKLAFSPVRRLSRLIVVATISCFTFAIHQASADQIATDPNLSLTISSTNQSVVLSWFGVSAVAYQMESSSNLTDWQRSGPMVDGRGATIVFTSSTAGQSSTFYRVGRVVPADNTAVFNPTTGLLTIVGDDQDNIIVVSRNAAGVIQVNNGAFPVIGGTATVANTVLIQMFGRAGNDQLSLNEVNGTLPSAHLFGEAGNDTLTGGAGNDMLVGGDGSDTLLGKGGADTLFGGDGSDALTGGDANDFMDGGAGNDRMIWNPGDDTDVIEGGSGTDTVEVNGGNGAETFTVTADGARVRFDRTTPAPFLLDIGDCEKLTLNANGGNDTLSCSGDLSPLIQITADGGTGDDVLLGSNGDDILRGGDNNDFIDGGPGNDMIFAGAGDDTVAWNPGGGSDTVEGQGGNDTLVFNGDGNNEILDLSANGSRFRFARNIGNVALDVAGIETVQANALGGVDVITVNNLSGTGVLGVNLDLSVTAGSGLGDSQADAVIVNATDEADSLAINGEPGIVAVAGLSAPVTIFGSDPTNDRLIVNALDGDDVVRASNLPAGIIGFTADGGTGADTLVGSGGNDLLLGGEGDDLLMGGPGIDTLDGGSGNNILIQD